MVNIARLHNQVNALVKVYPVGRAKQIPFSHQMKWRREERVDRNRSHRLLSAASSEICGTAGLVFFSSLHNSVPLSRWSYVPSERGGVRPLGSDVIAATAMPTEPRIAVRKHPVDILGSCIGNVRMVVRASQ